MKKLGVLGAPSAMLYERFFVLWSGCFLEDLKTGPSQIGAV